MAGTVFSLECKEYRLCSLGEDSPFYLLQSTEKPEVGLLLINPFVLFKNYEFDLEDEAVKQLVIEDGRQVAVFCTVNTSQGIQKATVNMLAPIVINVDRLVGKQVVLHKKDYSLRAPFPTGKGEEV